MTEQDVEAPIGSLAHGEPISVGERLTLSSIAAVLAELDVGAVVVRKGGEPAGVVSERDIVRAIAEGGELDIEWGPDVMTEGLVMAQPDEPIIDVADRMLDRGVRHVVLVEEGEPVGIVSMRDLFGVFARALRSPRSDEQG